MRNLNAGIGALLCSTALVTPVHAQDNQEDEADSNIIIVTATQRASDVQDIPIAVTAVTPVQLERQGIEDITTLRNVSASFNLNSTQVESQTTTIRIRGIGTTGSNIGFESAVGVFIDGVYQSRPGVALGDLLDLEQLEILRGPQGTLFGRNTTAGALVVKTKRPDLDELEGFANLTYGNFNAISGQAGISAPLVEGQLGARLSGSFRQRDGILTNTVTGEDANTRDRWQVRGQLLWEPSSDISLRLIGDYQKITDSCCDPVALQGSIVSGPALNALLLPGGAGFNEGLRDLESSSDGPISTNGEQWGVSAELNWDFGGAELTYIGAYRDFRNESRQDDFLGLAAFSLSGGTTPPGTQPFFDDIKTQTHELRFQGTAFDGALDWLVGAYYSDEDIIERQFIQLGPDFSRVAGPGTFGVSPTFLQNAANAAGLFSNGIFDPTNPAFGTGALGNNPLEDSFADNQFTQNAESFSVFTHNIINFTDSLSLTLGLRYVDDKKTGGFDQISSGGNACLATAGLAGVFGQAGAIDAANGNANVTNAVVGTIAGAVGPVDAFTLATQIPGAGGLTLGQAAVGFNCFLFTAPALGGPLGLPAEFNTQFDDDELIYTIQGSWKPNDDTLLYAGFTHGYKAGGLNLDVTAAVFGADPRFESELIDAYEVGLKTTLLDGRARANLALFYNELEGFQVLEFTGVQFQVFNVDDVTVKGAELELFAQWNDYISNSLAVTYTDAEYGDNCDGGVLSAASPLCGASLTNAPEIVGIFGMTYDGPINSSDWSMLANINVRYESSRRTRTNPASGPFDVQDPDFKINARLGFTTPDERFTFEVWGNNLSNEITRSATFNLPFLTGGAGAFVNDPRTYGATIRAKF